MDQSQLASMLAVVLSRATERILLVLVGGFAIYLGYKLFALIPAADRSEGKVVLPGGISIFLTRIGPGVFFALFGASVIGYSVTRPVQYVLPGVGAEPIVFSGFGARKAEPAEVPAELAIAGPASEVVVARLNGLLERAAPELGAPALAEFEAAVRSAKFAVILSGWQEKWGDRAGFALWAKENGTRDPPPGIAPGASVVFGTALR